MDLEPFGDDREDIRNGLIVQTLLNIFRDRKHKPRAFKLAECVVPGGDQFKNVSNQQPWQQMKFSAMLFCNTFMAGKEP